MKKIVLLLFAFCSLAVTKILAYEWTDENGVTWKFEQCTVSINGTSEQLWAIYEASGYGENITVPSVVYKDGMACTIEALRDNFYPIFVSGTNVTLPSTIKYIGFGTFSSAGTVIINRDTPPFLNYSNSYPNFGLGYTILVPLDVLNTYRNADRWKDLAVRIISQSAKTNYDIYVSAQSSYSGVHHSIGEDNLGNVMSLKVTGSINSYDIMIMRNKMHNLHHLDLTDANIVANSYNYYKNYSTNDNVLGLYAFYEMIKLISVKLPNTLTSIDDYAFYDCRGLKEITFGDSIASIGHQVFDNCGLTSVHISDIKTWCGVSFSSSPLVYAKHLFMNGEEIKELTIPNGVTNIASSAFQGCEGLTSVTIPNSLKDIGNYAFEGCINLTSVTMGSSVTTIGYDAFSHCSSLTSIIIPNSVSTINNHAFERCSSLASVSVGDGVTTIGNYAFYSCSSLKSVTLGTSVTTIGEYAFYSCGVLTDIHIPSSIRNIGRYAFDRCTNLKNYYTYTLEPTAITENTFSNWTTSTLHVPNLAYYNYYYDTQWSKFAHLVRDDNYFYIYFYLNHDFTFSDVNSDMESTPNVDLNPGSSLVVETSNSTVNFDKVHMADNSTAAASIIADGNLSIEELYFDITVNKNQWYFLSFPFRVNLSNVASPGNFVFRYYDGQTRAQNGNGGWKNVTDNYLNAHQGYIFQCNETGMLTLKVEKADMDFSGGDRQDNLTTFISSSNQNASWNFLGNPHSSYYDIDDIDYSAPITVWNGSTYQAVRAGDDQYHLSPFQAFFVQKPESVASLIFPASGRHTYSQWADRMAQKQAANARANVGADPVPPRYIVDLTISSGEIDADQTRVVFNDSKSDGYELDCDAAKFFADAEVEQIYALDAQGTQYAINERPKGEVPLGYVAVKNGELTISAKRMDCPVCLRDNEQNIIHDLSLGGYTFSTEQGSNEQRFTLVMENISTGIVDINLSMPNIEHSIYDLQGRRTNSSVGQKGVRLFKDGPKVMKVVEK